jgi:hypothetical protein
LTVPLMVMRPAYYWTGRPTSERSRQRHPLTRIEP